MTDSRLAEAIRQRITQQPFYNALSWKNTLENAAAFCGYLRASQETSINAVTFLPSFQEKTSRVDFNKMLATIKDHQQRASSRLSGTH